MAWTFWQPTKPTNLTGSLVAGGTLAPNTTYYFRVYAWDNGNTTTQRYNLTQQSSQIFSPYSDVFSITTDSVNKSVALSWNKVYKRDGITEVDAYEVIMSTSDNFLTAQDDAKFFPGNVVYFTPATNTNAFTVTSPPGGSNFHKNIKDGIPLCSWDGATPSCTFKSLYDALAADPYYNIFAKKITSPNDPNNVLGYEFLTTTVINRHTGDSTAGVYTFVSLGDFIINFGSFNCYGCKYNVRNSYLFFCGSSHAGGMSPFNNPIAGSFFQNNLIRYTLGTTPNGKSWGSMVQNYTPFINDNVVSDGNVYQNWKQTGEGINKPVLYISNSGFNRFTDTGSMNSLSDSQNDNSGAFWGMYFTLMGYKRMKKLVLNNRYGWYHYNSTRFGYDMTNNKYEYFQVGQQSFIDCIWRYRNFTGIADSDGWNPKLYTSSYYGPQTKNSLFYIGKSVMITVKDKNGNPISGAKVKFESSTGINLTRGNTLNDVCRVGGSARSNGNNYDSTETTITHDDDDIWLKENLTEGNIAVPTVGNTYWYGAEKITILSRDSAVVPWATYTHHYTATRGVDGTPSGWIISGNAQYDQRLVNAPEYLTTDANGFTFNPTLFRVYKINTLDKNDFLTNYLANNWATEYEWGPVKVTITAPGKQTRTIYISDSYAIALGTEPVNLEVNMDSQVPILVVDGDKLVLNELPESVENIAGYMEL